VAPVRRYRPRVFETEELGRKLDKDTYKARVPALRTELLEVQRALAEANFSVLVVVNGADTAGRGETVNLLNEWMDARFLRTHAFGAPTEEESQRPEYWRYWMSMPPRGALGLVVTSWYTRPILERVYGDIDDAALDAAMARINAFERAHADDHTLIIKIWLHIDKTRQKRRLKKLESNPDTRWQVGAREWKHHELYDEFRAVCSRVLRKTSTGEAPWKIIEGADARYREVAVAEHVLDRIRLRLARGAPAKDAAVPGLNSGGHAPAHTILDTIDLSQSLDKDAYESRLEQAQVRLRRLAREMGELDLGSILVFEGWDAAGKGGAIRRVTKALDARQYRVIPIAAPTDEEKAQHYLWRFWRHLPRLGRFTMYDRSWYGRVLVERVEGFAQRAEWMRAYKEINDFEEQLVEHGIVLLKFWVHISPEEQLRRFQEREQTPWKQHKITAEDYRNREKWGEYVDALSDMFTRTSTEYAPWHIIAGNDKRFARVDIVERLCESLEAAVEQRRGAKKPKREKKKR
jgi:polyphosphate:AMP phosphotransferase